MISFTSASLDCFSVLFSSKLYDHSWQFAMLHIIRASHKFHPGEGAQVCEIEGNEFSCPTADASINATCDTERCPLQGPPMAPIMESQLTGSAKKDFKIVLCIKKTEMKYIWTKHRPGIDWVWKANLLLETFINCCCHHRCPTWSPLFCEIYQNK